MSRDVGTPVIPGHLCAQAMRDHQPGTKRDKAAAAVVSPTQPLKSQREAEDELPQPQPSPLRALISSAALVARRALSGVAVRSASPAQVAPAAMGMDGGVITVRRRRCCARCSAPSWRAAARRVRRVIAAVKGNAAR